ncbi:MAG TPA: hypothetical protein VEM76_06410 [Anaeromyxobacteraceae bacterium]|nr:hypothetical protein [Anaeromyxobacteraceae bacterium]
MDSLCVPVPVPDGSVVPVVPVESVVPVELLPWCFFFECFLVVVVEDEPLMSSFVEPVEPVAPGLSVELPMLLPELPVPLEDGLEPVEELELESVVPEPVDPVPMLPWLEPLRSSEPADEPDEPDVPVVPELVPLVPVPLGELELPEVLLFELSPAAPEEVMSMLFTLSISPEPE